MRNVITKAKKKQNLINFLIYNIYTKGSTLIIMKSKEEESIFGGMAVPS